MSGRKTAFVAGALVVAVQSVVPLFGDEQRGLAPAFYDPGPGRGDAPKLHVFPLDGKRFTIPLPFQLGTFAVSSDGTALYAPRFGPKPILYKIEFGPIRVTKLRELGGLPSIYSIAASSSKIVFSAGYSTGEIVSRCGLYELMLSSGDVHQIVSNSDCEYASSWHSITLSPDRRRIVAVRKHRLELIDTETKAVQSLGEGFDYVAWSPNGRWIAALERSGDHTVVFDAATLVNQKTLPSTEVIWSPDSHAILVSRDHWYCGGYLGTLQLIDVDTGKTSNIPSSNCGISHIVFGWINVARP